MISRTKSAHTATACLSAVAVLVAGCASSRPGASSGLGPPSLRLAGRATFEHYLASLPPQVKMRHQVASRFPGRNEVMEGFCVLSRPGRFWMRVTTPLGGALFDIKSTADGHVELDSPIESIADAQSPFYVARDIRRIYLLECPANADLKPVADGFRVSCGLGAGSPSIQAEAGPDRPDDAMAETVSSGGIVREKEFYRDGAATAVVHYDDYRQIGDRWLAHRITLEGRGAAYSLTIALLSVDLAFDAERVFAPPPAPAPTPPP